MSASPLHELAELVFENAEKMPDGVYKSILDGLMKIKQSREEDERVADEDEMVAWWREQWWQERQEAKKLREENEKLRDEFQRFRPVEEVARVEPANEDEDVPFHSATLDQLEAGEIELSEEQIESIRDTLHRYPENRASRRYMNALLHAGYRV